MVAAIDSAAQSIEDFVAGTSEPLELTRPPESTNPQVSTNSPFQSTLPSIILKPVPDEPPWSQLGNESTTAASPTEQSIMNYDYSDNYSVEDPDWPGQRNTVNI